MDNPNKAIQQVQQRVQALEEELHQAREQLRRCMEEREEEAFRIHESSISAFIEHMPTAVAMLDCRMCYLSVSRLWMLNFHADSSDVIGRCLYDIFPILEAKWKMLLHRALMGETLRCEAESFQRADGNIEWMRWEMLPWRHVDGGTGGIIIFLDIITEQREIATALKESRNMLQLVLDTIPVRVFWKDTSERFIGANMLFAHDAGVASPTELLGKNDYDLVWQHEAALYQQDDRLVIASGEAKLNYEESQTTPDGTCIWLRTSKIPLRDANQRIIGILGVYEDITERKREQEERERLLAEVQRHAAELDAMIFAIADGLIIYGPHLEIIRMNGTAEEMFDFTPEMKALPAQERFKLMQMDTATGSLTSSPMNPIIRALTGESVHGQIITYVRPADGRKVWTAVSAAPIRAADGSITGVISTLSDVTLQHDLQQQQEDLLHIISHDLRLPLTVIHGHMQLLETLLVESGINGNIQVSCEAIDRSTQRMNTMIQDLVDAARLAGAQLELAITRVDVARYLADLLDRVKLTLAVERIVTDIAPDLPPVAADDDRLERILLNLLSNALKYSPDDSPVTIRARRQGSTIVIAISDRGKGILPEEQAHIFDRFYRVKGERKVEGIGLGLYITRLLVEAHGGRIWVESQPGQGSVFSFALPIAP